MSESYQPPPSAATDGAAIYLGWLLEAHGLAECRVWPNRTVRFYPRTAEQECAQHIEQCRIWREQAERLQAELDQLRTAAQSVCDHAQSTSVGSYVRTVLLIELQAALEADEL